VLKHPLFHTLFHLKGNARGAVLTEALWGIPYNLYAPYMSVYMLALGLRDSQIGLIASIGLGLQVFWAMVSGALTDKFGRRWTTFFSDMFSWSIPCLIWAISQNFYYFLAAAIFNSIWRVSHTSWTCILVEDTDSNLLVDIYTWIYIAGQLSAFFAPLAGILIHKYSLIPTVRALFFFSFIMMTAKFLIMNWMVTETERGKIRMQETKNQSIFDLLGEYRSVLGKILHSPATLYTLGLWLVMAIFNTVNGSFWAVLVTRKLLIPEQDLAIFPVARAVVMMVFFFFVTPIIRDMNFRSPMLVGLGAFMLSQLILITAPAHSYALLILSTVIESCASAAVGVQLDRMVAINFDEEERARVMSIAMVIVVLFSSPSGFIAGRLSEINRVLPFLLNIGLFAIGMVLVWQAARVAQKARDARLSQI
jgi:MFS family permease